MSLASVLQLINTEIIPNGNNEIDAITLQEVLVKMLMQPNELIGLLVNLDTVNKIDLVSAINELVNDISNINVINITNGMVDPNDNTGLTPNTADFYQQLTLTNNVNCLWIYNGLKWILINDEYISFVVNQNLSAVQKQIGRNNLDVYSKGETNTVVNSAILNIGNIVNSVNGVNVNNADPKNPIIATFRPLVDYQNDMLNKADIDGNLTTGGIWWQDQVLTDRFNNYKQVWTALSNNTIEWGNIELDKHIFLVDDINGIKVKVGTTEGTIWNSLNLTNVSQLNNNVGYLQSNDLDGFVYNVTYNSSTHTLTFFQQNEPNIVVDLPIEQLIKGVALVGNDLVFNFEDGSTVTVPLNTLLVGVVKSVNGKNPNSLGEVIINIIDIPGLSSALDTTVKIGAIGSANNPIRLGWDSSDMLVQVDNVIVGKMALKEWVIPLLNDKVDKVSGKQLSTEDYTTAEKNKLAGIQTGAEVNINADWNATSGDAQILNKPTIPSQLVYTGSNGISVTGTVISPVYGTASNTIAQGNDSRFHNAVTIGTANGLSLSGQVLSLGLASSTTNGALSTTDWNTFNKKVENFENAIAIGFSNGNVNDAPYFYHSSGTVVLLVTQSYLNTNYGNVVRYGTIGSGNSPIKFGWDGSDVLTQVDNVIVGKIAFKDWAIPLINAKYTFPSGGNIGQYINGVGALVNFPTIPTVGNGNIEYVGTGSITGGGISTSNQIGNTSYQFDLTTQTKADIQSGINAGIQTSGLFGSLDNYFQDLDVSAGGTVVTTDAFFTLLDPNGSTPTVIVEDHNVNGARLVVQSYSGVGIVTYKGNFTENGVGVTDILIENGVKKEFAWSTNIMRWREVF